MTQYDTTHTSVKVVSLQKYRLSMTWHDNAERLGDATVDYERSLR